MTKRIDHLDEARSAYQLHLDAIDDKSWAVSFSEMECARTAALVSIAESLAKIAEAQHFIAQCAGGPARYDATER